MDNTTTGPVMEQEPAVSNTAHISTQDIEGELMLNNYGLIARIIQQSILEGDLQVKEVATQVGKPYSTLLRELNPNDMGAKLGAETLFDLMKVTRNVEPLRMMAEELGFALVPTNIGGAVGASTEQQTYY